MRSTKAVFMKQMRDILKNREILIQYILFPIMAFIMTELVAKQNEDIPNNMFVIMFAAMFVGMTPLLTIANAIAEDRERKSLRFLVMAGVKPYEYVAGVGGFILIVSTLILVLFGLIGGFVGTALVKLVLIGMLGAVASILLGAAIGISSKNIQKATSLATPAALVLAFIPMLAQFDETISRVAHFLFTWQIGEIINNMSIPLTEPLLIIAGNGVIFAALFIFAYKKTGLKG